MKNSSQPLNILIERYPALEPIRGDIEAAFKLMVRCYEKGGKLIICGNGGSAADSEHIVGELMKSFLRARPLSAEIRKKLVAVDQELGTILANRLEQPLPALSLLSHSALATAFANDVDGELVFAQGLLGYATASDVVLAISTSGNSKNIRYALVLAKALGVDSVGLTGQSGGHFNSLCTFTIRVPEQDTARIQELHLPVYHTLCGMLEEHFFPQSCLRTQQSEQDVLARNDSALN